MMHLRAAYTSKAVASFQTFGPLNKEKQLLKSKQVPTVLKSYLF